MNYDTMSVHDLVLAIERLGIDEQRAGEYDVLALITIEAALRKAVIHEASVGTCHIGMGCHLTLDKPSTPDGDYCLIPKEAT